MQVAGRACDVCGEKIRTALDAVGCASCDVAHHADCLDDPEVCARCGERFGEAEAKSKAREDAAGFQTNLRGGAIVATLFSLLVLVSGAVTALVVSSAESAEGGIQPMVRFALLCGLLWLTYTGRPWARILTVTLLFLGGGLGLLFAGALFDGSLETALAFAWAGLHVLTAAVLIAVPSVRWFLEARRYAREAQLD